MKCKDFENNIVFFIDNELDENNTKMFEKHLASCHDCKKLYMLISQSYNTIGNDKITESNPFFYTRVKAAIENKKSNSLLTKVFEKKQLVMQFATYLIIGFFAIVVGYSIAFDDSVNENGLVFEQNEITDAELFAASQLYTMTSYEIYDVEEERIEE